MDYPGCLAQGPEEKQGLIGFSDGFIFSLHLMYLIMIKRPYNSTSVQDKIPYVIAFILIPA
jgi:hypothetical protein